MPSVGFSDLLRSGLLFVASGSLDDFEYNKARADDLATGFFEIDSDSIPVDGLNSAQSPVGLVGMTHDGAWRQQEIHWVLCILCNCLQYRPFITNTQFVAVLFEMADRPACELWAKFAGSEKPDFKAC